MNPFVDSAFPGLAVALNPEKMIELLRNALKKDYANLEIKEAKILDVKYKPGQEGVLLYRFKINDPLTKISHKLLFTATLLKEEEVAPPAGEQLTQEKNVLIRNRFFYFEDPKIFLCAFPCDPRMPWLGDALDEVFMQKRLNLICSYRKRSVQELKIDLLNYTPRLRAVFLYHVQMKDNETGDVSSKEWIGKTSSYKVPEILFADLRALWKACEGNVGVPRPETYFSHPRLLLQERLPGKRLGDLFKSSYFQDALRQTARDIAFIHRTKIPLNKMRDPFRETQSLRHWSVVLQNIRSDLARELQALQESLLREMEARTRVTGTVHGDFHPANVLVDHDRINIIDFDQMAYGDPAADIGRFLASLRTSSLRHFGDLSSLDEARELFLDEYLNAAQANLPNIRMFESASLITTAASAFRVQRPGWEKEVLLMLEESEQVFEKAKTSAKVSLRPVKEPSLKFDQINKWLHDPAYMHAVLGLYLRRNYDAEIFACEILKTIQTESTLRILYRVEGQKQMEPWNCELEGIPLKHSRGRRMFNQVVSLQESSDEKEEAFVIPTPVAYLSVLKTIIQMPLSGIPLSSLLGHSEVPVLARRLARAMSIVHKVKAPWNQRLSTLEICERVDHAVLELKKQNPDFFVKAQRILAQTRERIPKHVPENAMTIAELTPDQVLWIGDRVGISQVAGLVLSHPCVDICDLLAQIIRLGLERNQQQEAETMAKHLRTAYCEFEGQGHDLFAEFETIALLNVACSLAKNVSKNSIARQLLERAEAE